MAGTPLGARMGITLPRTENMYVSQFYFVELWLIDTDLGGHFAKDCTDL